MYPHLKVKPPAQLCQVFSIDTLVFKFHRGQGRRSRRRFAPCDDAPKIKAPPYQWVAPFPLVLTHVCSTPSMHPPYTINTAIARISAKSPSNSSLFIGMPEGRGVLCNTNQHTPKSPLQRGLLFAISLISNFIFNIFRPKGILFAISSMTATTILIPLLRGVPEGRGVSLKHAI